MNTNNYPVKKSEEVKLQIEKLAYGGKGISRINDYVIFVNNTLPGDLVRAKIIKRKKNYATARLLEIIDSSKLRRPAPCPYFGWCGGCTWQNLAYSEQLRIKREQVLESVDHIAGLEQIRVEETIPSPLNFAYRNKMEFSFSDRRWLLPSELNNEAHKIDFALGLHIPGTFDKILDIDNCLLQSEAANNVLNLVKQFCKEKKIPVYGLRSQQGFLRFLVIRQSRSSGELMVNIVTHYKEPTLIQPLADQLMKKIPEVTSVINTINRQKAQVAYGDEALILNGENHITDQIGEYTFNISANSFFQTNTIQAEKLYRIVMEYSDLKGNEIVWDLYAGTGTISLFLAERAKIVYAFELIESAVIDAKKNAQKYKVKNIRFISGDILDNFHQVSDMPDVIVIDPPRAGIHPKITEFLNHCEALRIIYVSCNPTTLARDLEVLSTKYRIIKVQPVDMFPHTYHIESVTLLERIL